MSVALQWAAGQPMLVDMGDNFVHAAYRSPSRRCDTAQGFLFFRPEPPEEVAKLFAAAPIAVAAHGRAATDRATRPMGGGPIGSAHALAPIRTVARQRRLTPAPGIPGSRRRLARSSLLAGVKAIADTWINGESRV